MPGKNFEVKSFWMKTRDYEPGEPLGEEIQVDVAIIGELYAN